MTQPVLLALVVALIGCQRNRATVDEESAAKAAATAVPAVPAATPAAAPTPAAPSAAPSAAMETAPSPGGQPDTVAPAGVWQASPIGRDLERICNVLTYANVTDKSSRDQLNAILEWLPRNIESEAGRNFLGSIGNLEGNAKADALDSTAIKVGLEDCPLSASWRK